MNLTLGSSAGGKLSELYQHFGETYRLRMASVLSQQKVRLYSGSHEAAMIDEIPKKVDIVLDWLTKSIESGTEARSRLSPLASRDAMDTD